MHIKSVDLSAKAVSVSCLKRSLRQDFLARSVTNVSSKSKEFKWKVKNAEYIFYTPVKLDHQQNIMLEIKKER